MKKFLSETKKVTLLVLKQPDKFPSWLQLKIIVRVLDQLETKVQAAKGAIHFKAAQKGFNTPSIIWTECKEDWPKDNRNIPMG